MIPKTVSASSLSTADGCLARYKAENLDFTPSPAEKVAANVGTACHGALEDFVRMVHLDKTHAWTWDLLEILYKRSYLKTFDTVEWKTPEYKDGLTMVRRWFDRTDLSGRTVISVETKTRMPIPTSVGEIPMTYIWDRCDTYIEDGLVIVEVTDYKTIRAMLGPDDVRDKLQARIYDLAVRAQFRDTHVDEFRIVFDLLRYDPVGVVYSREEAVETWAAIKARCERIIATDGARPPETINAECGYCVRKLTCKTLQKNVAGGGVFAVSDDLSKVAEMRMTLANQLKGMESALEELDTILVQHAKNEDVLVFNEGEFKITISARKRRNIDSVAAGHILGPDIMSRHGKLSITDIDKMIASGALTPEQIKALDRTIGYTVSDASVKVVPTKK